MAGGGAKKRAEENKAKLQGLALYIFVCAQIHGMMRLWYKADSATAATWAAFGATLAVQGVCFLAVLAVGRPTYNGDTLLDGGGDLSKGMISYYFDIVYVTGFVQVVASLHPAGWYAYLVVPAYGAYMLGANVILPWIHSAYEPDAPDAPMDKATRKKLELAEKRAERRRVKRI